MSIITGERPRFRLAIFAAGALAAGTMGFAGPAQADEAFHIGGTVTSDNEGLATYVSATPVGDENGGRLATPGSDGSFDVADLPGPGVYHVSSRICDAGYNCFEKTTDVTLTDATPAKTDLDLHLKSSLASDSGSISGHQNVGETLTADYRFVQDYAVTGTWQWYRFNGGGYDLIPGATDASYTLTSDDKGTNLLAAFTATSTEGYGSNESISYTNDIGAPIDIKGTILSAKDGVTLSSSSVDVYSGTDPSEDSYIDSVNADEDGTYAITDLPGAGTYTLQFYGYADDGDTQLIQTKTVTFAGSQLPAVDASVNTELRSNDSYATIGGSFNVGQVITATTGGYSPAGYGVESTWTWHRFDDEVEDEVIEGATTSTYALTDADKGFQVYAVHHVVSTSGWGQADVYTENTPSIDGPLVAPVPAPAPAAPATLPFAGSSPAVKGAGKVGKTLSAPVLAVPAGGTVTYQWYRVAKAGKHHRVITKAIGGARTSKYKLKKKDKGTKVFVTEVVTAPGYATAAVSTKPVRVH